eukprot:1373908-Amphidinium_carterae.1
MVANTRRRLAGPPIAVLGLFAKKDRPNNTTKPKPRAKQRKSGGPIVITIAFARKPSEAGGSRLKFQRNISQRAKPWDLFREPLLFMKAPGGVGRCLLSGLSLLSCSWGFTHPYHCRAANPPTS